tara:strand:+ start:1028 stop:1420 length:393 start_codon:yes stop_codon:yes gene_type:complete
MNNAEILKWTYEDIISDKSKASYMLTVLLGKAEDDAELLNYAHIDTCTKIAESRVQRKVYVKVKDSIDALSHVTQQAQDGTLAGCRYCDYTPENDMNLTTKLRYACNGLMTAVNSAVGIRDTKVAFKQVK